MQNHIRPSVTSNLALGNWLDPANGHIGADSNRANDPEAFRIIRAIVPEDDGKDDATKATGCASGTTNNAVCEWMHVRDVCEVQTVGTLEEECGSGNESEHCRLLVRVYFADDDKEDARDDGIDMQHDLFAPHATGIAIREIADESTQRPGHNVEETKHGSPVSVFLQREFGEVLVIVIAQNAINGQLGAEGAEIACAGNKGLEGEENTCSFFECRFLNNLALGDLDHLLGTNLDFIIGIVVGFLFFLVGHIVASNRVIRVAVIVVHFTRDSNNNADAMLAKVGISSRFSLRPLSSGTIWTKDKEKDCRGGDQDTGNNKGNAPRIVF